MNFENVRIYGFESALRGMRNPLESWGKSDSFFGIINYYQDVDEYQIADLYANKITEGLIDDISEADDDFYDYKIKVTEKYADWLCRQNDYNVGIADWEFCHVDLIGPNDLALACRLIKAGPEHRKFLRQIFVSVDITAPLYW